MPFVNRGKAMGAGMMPAAPAIPPLPVPPGAPAGGYSSPKMPVVGRLDQLVKMAKTGKQPGGGRLWEKKTGGKQNG